MDFPIDPSILNRPMNELELPKEDKSGDGIQLQDVEALLKPAQAEEGQQAPSLDSDDDSKVPYRRFKKFHDRALEAEREAEYWRSKALERPAPEQKPNYYQPPTPNQYTEPVYQGADWERFKALFQGADENAVKEAYRLEVQRISAVEERAVQRASEMFEQRSSQQQETVHANRAYLDEWTDEASDLVGRDLSPAEEEALLDILDEYSPKDANGQIEAPVSVETAIRIYEMQQNSRAPRREARNAIASISGNSAGGDTSVAQTPQENNQKYNAQLGWRANFQRLTGKDANRI